MIISHGGICFKIMEKKNVYAVKNEECNAKVDGISNDASVFSIEDKGEIF